MVQIQLIYSTHKSPMEAACDAIWETNDGDTLDMQMIVDERGIRTKETADELTCIFTTDDILKQAGRNNY